MAAAEDDNPPVIITGLRDGVLRLDDSKMECKVDMRCCELKHASALLEVVSKGKKRYGWQIRDKQFGHVAKIRNYTDIVIFGVLPLLLELDTDTNRAGGRLLRRFGFNLQQQGRKLDGPDGPLCAQASTAGKVLRKLNRRLCKGDWIWAADLDEARRAMEDLKSVEVVIPRKEVVGGGIGVGANDDPEAAEPTKAAQEPPVVTITSLRDALLRLDDSQKQCKVEVTSVEVQHASAVLEVVARGVTKYNWQVRDEQFMRVAKIHDFVDVVLSGVIPLLRDDPTSLAAGRLLRRYGINIQRQGRKLDGPDGPLCAQAFAAGEVLRKLNRRLRKGERIGSADLDEACRGMEDLMTVKVLIPAKPGKEVVDGVVLSPLVQEQEGGGVAANDIDKSQD